MIVQRAGWNNKPLPCSEKLLYEKGSKFLIQANELLLPGESASY